MSEEQAGYAVRCVAEERRDGRRTVLTARQRHLATRWVEEHREEIQAGRLGRREVAEACSQAVGATVTVHHLETIYEAADVQAERPVVSVAMVRHLMARVAELEQRVMAIEVDGELRARDDGQN